MPPKLEIEKSPIGCTAANPDPKEFNKWCKAHDVLWPKCRTGMSASTGRCVLASKDIAAGEVVVELPDAMVLMAENCTIQELLEADGLTKPADDALLEVQGLVLAVLYEKALGSKSQWGPYLSFLPSDLSHMIIFWEETELAELVGTAAHDKLLGRVQHAADAPTRVRQLFEELVVPFVCGHEGVASVLLGGSKAAGAALQEEAQQKLWQPYLWATAAVASYSFVLGDEHYQGMVAVWDLLNHITGAVNVRLHHGADKGVLQMIATEDIPKGAEVVNCYGHLSNAELLRGYGYVEQHNSIKHVQVPAHFCIKAAAATAAAATAVASPGRKTGGKPSAAGAAVGRSSEKEQGSSESGADDGEQSSDGDEQGSESASGDDEDDSSSEDESSSEGSEPDWDLEDDEPEALQQQKQRLQEYWAQQQQQQQQDEGASEGGRARKKQKRDSKSQKQQQQHPAANGVQTAAPSIPSLAEAQGQVSDWEERWQLCFSLGLLPKNGVIQVPAGGLNSCPGQLLAVLLLLVGQAEDCAALAAAAAAATKAAAAAAAGAAAAAAEDGGKGGKVSKNNSKGGKQQKQACVQQQQQGRSKRSRPGMGAADAGLKGANGAEASLAAGVKADLDKLQFTPPALLTSALQHLVLLMQSRYSCSLQQDQQLLQDQSSLAPRLAAAVTARSAEKEVWQELQQALQEAGVEEKVMRQARGALQQAVLTTAQEAAAAKARRRKEPAHDCCGKPGCAHEHHEHHEHGSEEGHEHDGDAAAAKPGHGQSSRSKGTSAAEGFAFNFEL